MVDDIEELVRKLETISSDLRYALHKVDNVPVEAQAAISHAICLTNDMKEGLRRERLIFGLALMRVEVA